MTQKRDSATAASRPRSEVGPVAGLWPPAYTRARSVWGGIWPSEIERFQELVPEWTCEHERGHRKGHIALECALAELARRGVDPCPQAEIHTPCPPGYIAWHEWAGMMSKTHRQQRCRGCGLYAVWVPK